MNWHWSEKKWLWAKVRYYCSICLEWTRKSTQPQDSWSLDSDLNSGLLNIKECYMTDHNGQLLNNTGWVQKESLWFTPSQDNTTVLIATFGKAYEELTVYKKVDPKPNYDILSYFPKGIPILIFILCFCDDQDQVMCLAAQSNSV